MAASYLYVVQVRSVRIGYINPVTSLQDGALFRPVKVAEQ